MNTLSKDEKEEFQMNKIEPIMVYANAAIKLQGDHIIYIDPFQIPKEMHDTDFIFITHPHWDHFSLIDILKTKKKETNFIIPKELFEELIDIGIPENQILVVKPNQTFHFENLKFETIRAYNLKKEYHPRNKEWVGYIITMNQIIYYIAGDTDVTNETKKIKADVIFLPVGGTYTMTAKEAATLANIIKPHLAIPIHYLSVVGSLSDAREFCENVDAKIATKIYYKEKNDVE